MLPVKIYLDIKQEDLIKLQNSVHFQNCSRRIYRILIKAVNNEVSVNQLIEVLDYLLEKKLIADKKGVLKEIFNGK